MLEMGASFWHFAIKRGAGKWGLLDLQRPESQCRKRLGYSSKETLSVEGHLIEQPPPHLCKKDGPRALPYRR